MGNLVNKILPSEFKRRITVKRPNSVTDDSGGTSNAGYTVRFSTWAKIDQLKTQQKVMYGIDAFLNAYKITIRFTNSRQLTIADLIDYEDGTGTRTLDVKDVQLVSEDYKNFLIIVASEFNVNG